MNDKKTNHSGGKCVQCSVFLAILKALHIDVETPEACSTAPKPQEMATLLNRKEVMYRLNITESTYTRWLERGILVPRRVGKRHFYTEADLERAFEESARKGKR